MIAMLTGTVAVSHISRIILDVQGVGYNVAVRPQSAFTLGASVRLFTHLAVRENALDLYGFVTEDELSMFELLLTIPKIGPKSAMQILSQADLALLKEAIVRNDASYLSKMSGIGKKTAEKIVVELHDKLGSSDESAWNGATSEDTDIIDALTALGYAPKDAREVIAKLSAETTGTNARIAEALRHLSS